MRRVKLSVKASRRNFRRGAKTHKLNHRRVLSRGGIRL